MPAPFPRGWRKVQNEVLLEIQKKKKEVKKAISENGRCCQDMAVVVLGE